MRKSEGKNTCSHDKKKINIRRKEVGYKDWWDRSCIRKKREVKRIYWKWRKGRIGRGEYVKKRKEIRELYKDKQKEKRTEEEELKKKRSGHMEIYKQAKEKKRSKRQ